MEVAICYLGVTRCSVRRIVALTLLVHHSRKALIELLSTCGKPDPAIYISIYLDFGLIDRLIGSVRS